MVEVLFYISFVFITILFFFVVTLLLGWRFFMKGMVRKIGKIIMSDSYQENLIELMPGFQHLGIQNTLENSLRAQTGDMLNRPLGSSRYWPHFDSITFLGAQTGPFPTSKETEVNVSVTIGPKTKKPMQLEKPFLISGMGYGVGVNEGVRIAFAQAATETGIAINSGEGGVLPEEVETAEKFILQMSKTEWGKEDEIVKQADMIELKLGQGSSMGMGTKISPDNLTGKAREVMGLEDEQDAIIHEHFFENQQLSDFKELIDDLRKFTGGVPIGAKIGAGGKIETDIDHLLEMGVDFIAVDGGQAGTHSSPPILADDFGIPTLHAVVRAHKHLEKRKVKDKVSLIVSGGLLTPGHFLKVLALGADAVYLGSAILLTVSHHQSLKALPFEPPTQVVWNEGKYSNTFNVKDGATTVKNFLNSSTEEIREALRAMGKTSLNELSTNDLVSYDETTAHYIGIPYTFKTWEGNGEKTKRNNRKRR